MICLQQCLQQMKEMQLQIDVQSTHDTQELATFREQVQLVTMNSVFASRNIPVRATKAMLAPFDGSNPLEWIFQAESYFELNQVAIPQHLALVPFFMTGLALAWFTWLHATHQLTQAVQISPVPWNFDLGHHLTSITCIV